nr:MAG TPA: hypothetical protein [Caudoviricetes sp.]
MHHVKQAEVQVYIAPKSQKWKIWKIKLIRF